MKTYALSSCHLYLHGFACRNCFGGEILSFKAFKFKGLGLIM